MADPIASSYLSAVEREELPALTGLRIVAALAVVIWHSGHFMPAMPPVFNHGYLGVDLFFILSGFIIAHVYWRDFQQPTRQTYARFIALRLARLWPAHIAVILMFLLAIGAWTLLRGRSPVTSSLLPEIVLHFFLAHNWIETRLNFPSWSVSAEFFAYLIFPLQVMLFRRTENRWLLALCVPLAMLVCWMVISLGFDRPLAQIGPLGFVRVLCEFAMGMALWRLWRSGSFAALPWTAIVLLALAGIIGVAAVTPSWHALDYLIVLLMAPLLLGLAQSAGPAARLLSLRPIVYLGEISYSIYLMHIPADLLTRSMVKHMPGLFGSRAAGWDIVALSVILAIAGGALLFHLVEKPARLFLRARIQRHMPHGRTAVAAA